MARNEKKDSFSVFEESYEDEILKKPASLDIECQTEETSRDVESQTEETIKTAEGEENDEENALIEYWTRVLSGCTDHIDHMKKLNEELEIEIASESEKLKNKTTEYDNLFALAASKLEDVDEVGEEEDYLEDSVVVITP